MIISTFISCPIKPAPMSGWFVVSHSVLTGFNSCDMGKVYTDNKTKILDFGMETEWESSFSVPADIKTM